MGEQHGTSVSCSQSVTRGCRDKSSTQDPGGRNCHGGTLLTSLRPVCFLSQPRTACLVVTLTPGTPTHHLPQKCPYRLAYRPIKVPSSQMTFAGIKTKVSCPFAVHSEEGGRGGYDNTARTRRPGSPWMSPLTLASLCILLT